MSIFPKHASPGQTITLHCRVGQRPSLSDLTPLHLRGTVTRPDGSSVVVLDRPALLAPFTRHLAPADADPALLRFDPLHHLMAASTSQALLDGLTLSSLASLGLAGRSNAELLGALGTLGLNRFTEEGLVQHLAHLIRLQISDHHYAHYTVPPEGPGGRYAFAFAVTHPDGRVSVVEDSFFVEHVTVETLAGAESPAVVVNQGDVDVLGHVVDAWDTTQPVMKAAAEAVVLAPGPTVLRPASAQPAWLLVAEGTTPLALNRAAAVRTGPQALRASA